MLLNQSLGQVIVFGLVDDLLFFESHICLIVYTYLIMKILKFQATNYLQIIALF